MEVDFDEADEQQQDQLVQRMSNLSLDMNLIQKHFIDKNVLLNERIHRLFISFDSSVPIQNFNSINLKLFLKSLARSTSKSLVQFTVEQFVDFLELSFHENVLEQNHKLIWFTISWLLSELSSFLDEHIFGRIIDIFIKIFNQFVTVEKLNFVSFKMKESSFHYLLVKPSFNWLFNHIENSNFHIKGQCNQVDKYLMHLVLINLTNSISNKLKKPLIQDTYDKIFVCFVKMFSQYCEEDKICPYAIDYLTLEMFQTSFQKYVYWLLIKLNESAQQHDWNYDRMWCWTLKVWSGKDHNVILWDTANMDRLFDYLLKLLSTRINFKKESNEHYRAILYGILLVEDVCLYFERQANLNGEHYEIETKKNALKKVLTNHFYYPKNVSPLTSTDLDSASYQLNFCARWCVDNVIDKQSDSLLQLPAIKLTSDRLEARNDAVQILYENYISPPVCSLFAVTSGVYYYEVILITKKIKRIGWRSNIKEYKDPKWIFLHRLLSFSGPYNEFDDENVFIGLDTSRNSIWQSGKEYQIRTRYDYHPGTVIGCLIDVNKSQCVFYVNGHREECPFKFDKNFAPPYYAAASLTFNQHCHFNFGQEPFKHAPYANKDIAFNNFHNASFQNANKYQLIDTYSIYAFSYEVTYWFKRPLVNNKVDIFFKSTKIQNECDEKVKRLENEIINDDEHAASTVDDIKSNLNKDKNIYLRYIQSLIEVMGNEIKNNAHKIDVMTSYMCDLIDCALKFINIRTLDFIYPYLVARSSEDYKRRNVCILLMILIVRCKKNVQQRNTIEADLNEYNIDFKYILPIRNEIFTYLIRALSETSDKWTKEFAIFGLKELELNLREQGTIQHNVIEKLNPMHKLMCQTLLLNVKLNQSKQAELSIDDRTQGLFLSPCLMDAFSIRSWQSVRSVEQITKGIHYFEVTLRSNGLARIGWAATRTNLKETKLGGDDYSFAFDGFNRCVWYRGEQYPIATLTCRWKAGDLIGCLIDVTNQKFEFFMNGTKLVLSSNLKIFFVSHPYRVYQAAVSLSTFQRCRFNFGPSFVHPPENIEYYNYYPIRSKYNTKKRGRCLILSYKQFYEFKDNQWSIIHDSTRHWNELDVRALRETFNKLNFEVISHEDLIKQKTEEILRDESQLDHSESDCFVMCILSHGQLGNLGEIEYEFVFDQFECTSLIGKPKLFFIEACQGSAMNHGQGQVPTTSTVPQVPDQQINNNTQLLPLSSNIFTKPKRADMLIHFASYPGYTSMSDNQKGSWFTQILCQVLNEFADTEDILSMLTRVNAQVTQEAGLQLPQFRPITQMPQSWNCLTKKLKFY